MNDTLELNLTLGHPITPDVLPNIESEETLPATEETARVINRTKITRKVLHWTLLKIEFTNPSKPMMMQLEDDEGEDVKLAHYLLLRSLTPSCLAERCPNTKHLEETLRLISKVFIKFCDEIRSHSKTGKYPPLKYLDLFKFSSVFTIGCHRCYKIYIRLRRDCWFSFVFQDNKQQTGAQGKQDS